MPASPHLLLQSTVAFKTAESELDLPEVARDLKTAALGPLISYDSRDSNYFPRKGQYFRASWMNYAPRWGSDVSYEYAFVRQPTYEVPASAGVHFMGFKIQLSGTATVTDAEGNTSEASATSKSNSLPVVGLRAGWVVAPDWYIDVQGQLFKVKVGDYDGRWSDLRVGATWMFHRNYGLGLGYNYFTSKLDVTKNDFNGRLNVEYSGVQAYLAGTF